MGTTTGPAFTFAAPGRLVFGAGRSAELPDLVAEFGVRPLVVTGSNPSRHAELLASLGDPAVATVKGEPTLGAVRQAVDAARTAEADVVVGVGGGAVLDTAKAVAGLAASESDPLDHLEVVGLGLPLPPVVLPWIGVPTTAGTGSEMTNNAVVTSLEHGVKASIRGRSLLAEVALVDPLLTLECPPAVTASSGLDALTQCLEAYVTHQANPLTDGFCREGLRRAASGLRRAYADGSDVSARTDMALCAALSGLALANAKLGAVHGFAGPLGGMIGAAHGTICASLLPSATRVNVAALTARGDGTALARYTEAAEIITGRGDVAALLAWLDETNELLGVPGLADLGLTEDRLDEAVAKGQASSSMKGNPITLTEDELQQILRAALD
ncbi:MAG: iron-containing alcohol dehydrogenase [Brooklawnia sp.]|uniref:iron-containing alcohol dehydrogenase n=1 Tax=Brooklawnia sp. TaxID=2699740 RepID=UPI003C718F63